MGARDLAQQVLKIPARNPAAGRDAHFRALCNLRGVEDKRYLAPVPEREMFRWLLRTEAPLQNLLEDLSLKGRTRLLNGPTNLFRQRAEPPPNLLELEPSPVGSGWQRPPQALQLLKDVAYSFPRD